MAPTIPTCAPETIEPGTTVKWSRAFADFPVADGWSVSYRLAGAKAITVAGVAQTSDFLFTLSATDSAQLTPGTYRIRPYATLAGETYPAEAEATLVVVASLQTATDGQLVSHAERTLAVIEAAIEGRLTKDQEAYAIDGLQVTRIPMEQLVKLRGRYVWAVWRQRHPGQLGPNVAVAFNG